VLIDDKAVIARKYEARTTPHMFVINPQGNLAYMGGIDDRATTDKGDIAKATNYVRAALDAVEKGQPVAMPVSRPYGCSIKYAPEQPRS
jgi:hypothetical protein